MSQTVQKVLDKVSLATYNRRIRYKQGGESMSEREKNLAQELNKALDSLDPEKKSYLLGLAEGMAMTKEEKADKEPVA